jgi:hypothetical protein
MKLLAIGTRILDNHFGLGTIIGYGMGESGRDGSLTSFYLVHYDAELKQDGRTNSTNVTITIPELFEVLE